MSPSTQGSNLSRRTFLRGAGGVAILAPLSAGGLSLLLSGCSTDTKAPQSDNPTKPAMIDQRYMTSLGLGSNFLEVMVAQERGFFKSEGINIEIRGGQGSGPSMQSLISNSVDYSRSDPIVVIPAIADQDAPLVAIATVQQTSPFEIASLKDNPIKNIKDMEGKTIGIISAGGGTEIVLDLMLAGAGVPAASVSRPVVGVGFAPYELARTKKIDGWVAQTTARASIEKQSGPLEWFNTSDYTKLPSSSYWTTLDVAKAKDDAPVRFLAGVHKAMEFMLDESNWEQAIKDLQKYNPEADTEQSLFELPLLLDSWTARGEDQMLTLDKDAWVNGQKELVDAGVVEKPADIGRLMNSSFIEKARSEA